MIVFGFMNLFWTEWRGRRQNRDAKDEASKQANKQAKQSKQVDRVPQIFSVVEPFLSLQLCHPKSLPKTTHFFFWALFELHQFIIVVNVLKDPTTWFFLFIYLLFYFKFYFFKFKIYFFSSFIKDPGTVPKNFGKKNFTWVSKCRFSHILYYELVFKADFHIPIIINFIISNNFLMFKNYQDCTKKSL